MSIGPTIILTFIGYLIILISQRAWSMLGIIIIFETIWATLCLYLCWVSIETSDLSGMFWAITTIYFGAVELALLLVTTLLYSDLVGQTRLW